MSSSRERIGVLMGVATVGLGVLLLHLWWLMVVQHPVWARRGHENHWSFRAVPSRRGSILDRTGRVLVHDEPAMELSLYYQRFRLRHPVGAAVHGATQWARLRSGGEPVTYSYLDGVLGPEAAVRDLLAVPVGLLRPGVLDKAVVSDVVFAATTVLAACGNVPRKYAYAALRDAARGGSGGGIGDVLPSIRRAELLASHARILQSLHQFAHDLGAEAAAKAGGTGVPAEAAAALFAQLEQQRRASLAGDRVRLPASAAEPAAEPGAEPGAEPAAEPQPRFGDLIESIAWPFADAVSFELAARLRVQSDRHPGIEIGPSVRRICAEPDGSSLRALLGAVVDIGEATPSAEWLKDYVQRGLAGDWLDDFVPADAAATAEERRQLQREAMQGLRNATRRHERRGISGIEAGFNDVLNGRLGMRLVERDSSSREQALWSNLRVEAGADLRLTIDLELQRLAESFVRRKREAIMALHVDDGDRSLVQASLAVIDARSGDILALVGSPVAGNAPRQVPGVRWSANGSLGSVVKPFVLVEQLEAEALGRPCHTLGSLQPCAGKYPVAGVRLGCRQPHWDEGRDPVAALAKSCNTFFFQCAEGLGERGVQRALQRFGLCAAHDGPFQACWQADIEGLPWAPPTVGPEVLQRRAIGYAVQASPLAVARGYAALATGSLPTLGLRAGETRPRVSLGGLATEIEVVRQGLAACVQTGTAHGVSLLADFQVLGKTGTAEVGVRDHENNAWFAGFLPWSGRDGVQLCFCAVVYWVPHGVHGGDDAAQIVGDLLAAMNANPELRARYVLPEGGR